MKTLNTIQKTCKVFKILTKAAMIISFVWAGLTLTGLICGIAWKNGGTIIGVDMDTMLALTQTTALDRMIGELLGDGVFALTDGLLYLFAWRYFCRELEDGTPFTQRGADAVKVLGIQTIVLPQVAAVVYAAVCGWFDLARLRDWSHGGFVTLGIALILFSLVLRCGAQLIGRTPEEVHID